MIQFSTYSYLATAALYALLTLLLLTSWRGRRVGAYLIVSCIVSFAWGVTLALQAAEPRTNVALVFVTEVLRGGTWITFLTVLLTQIGVGRRLRYASMATWIIVLFAGMAVFANQPDILVIQPIANIMIPGGLVIALVGLVLIEQLYRNTSPDARWGIKALVLGLGGIFTYDLYLYSQGMLFGAIDSNIWLARGAVNILFVPLIAIAARRNPTWDLDIFVSRQVVFYSTTLVAVGLYLLIMSLGAYALVLYGGNWGAVAQIIFLAGALLILLVLIFSTTLRARVRVFLSKHFFRNKYDYREEWLRLVATLSEFEDSSTREIVIRSIAQIVGSPAGILWILDEPAGQYRVAACYSTSTSPPDIPVDAPIIKFIKREFWLIDLDEYRAEPDNYGDLELPEWMVDDMDCWLVVPLSIHHQLLGLIIVHRGAIKVKLNYEDRDLLK
ncbi:MAG: PEP-CTERM system histidine kinase PrsK, partial [Acidiferrobacterales bacterium]|nr:PEP-CTERM system histidine kinase PrsK [Acidiferrobacterales bacterium]